MSVATPNPMIGLLRAYLLDINDMRDDIVTSAYDNLILDGGFENWSGGSLDEWVVSAANAPTVTQTGDGLGDTTKHGGAYAAKLQRNAGGDGYIAQSIPNYKEYQGRDVSYSCWIKCATGSRVQLRIDDGVSTSLSPANTGSGDWERLTLTAHGVNANATELTFQILLTNAQIDVYVDEAMATPSVVAPDFVPPASSARSAGGVTSFNDFADGGPNLTGAVKIEATNGIVLAKNTTNNSVKVGIDSSSNIVSIHRSTSSALYGDVILAASNGIVLGQAAQTITVENTGVLSVAAKATGVALTGAVVLEEGANITLTRAGQVITVAGSASANPSQIVDPANTNTYISATAGVNQVRIYRDGGVKAIFNTNNTFIYGGTNQYMIEGNDTRTIVYGNGTEGVRVGSAGIVNMANQSSIYALMSSNGASHTSGEIKTVPFDVKVRDVQGEFNTNGTLFTAADVGQYHVDAQVLMGGLQALDSLVIGYIYKNGTQAAYSFNQNRGNFMHIQLSKTLSLATGDTLQILSYQASGTNVAYVFGDASGIGSGSYSYVTIDKIG